MALPPQKSRELTFQLLYSCDIGVSDDKALVEMLMEQLSVSKKYVLIAKERVASIQARLHELDALIGQTVFSYEFDRIQSVERNILRLCAYELLFDHNIPPVVCIAEGVRLAKKFGTPESASFINAVLDAMYKSSKGDAVDIDTLHKQAENLKKSEAEVSAIQQSPPTPDSDSE